MTERLLIVDDERAIGSALRRFFEGEGYVVDFSSEMEEAQALAANVAYVAVIADLRLTGVHGAEGLEIIRYVRDHCPNTRTILLTAYSTSDLEAEARNRGVDVVVRKPTPLGDLAQILQTLLSHPRDDRLAPAATSEPPETPG